MKESPSWRMPRILDCRFLKSSRKFLRRFTTEPKRAATLILQKKINRTNKTCRQSGHNDFFVGTFFIFWDLCDPIQSFTSSSSNLSYPRERILQSILVTHSTDKVQSNLCESYCTLFHSLCVPPLYFATAILHFNHPFRIHFIACVDDLRHSAVVDRKITFVLRGNHIDTSCALWEYNSKKDVSNITRFILFLTLLYRL